MKTSETKRPWYRSEFFFIGLIIILLIIYQMSSLNRGIITIGMLVDEKMITDPEIDAAFNFLDRGDVYDPQKIFVSDITNTNRNLENFDIIWFHFADSSGIPNAFKDPKLIGILQKYVDSGGKLLLTQEAFTYLQTLGLENAPAQLAYADAVDDGYGRKLGFHAYIDHPLFKNLHGGATIFNPFDDTRTRQWGYLKADEKINGKVIGIDWSYITFFEHKRLILEYEQGDGKVLAIGAYTLFNMQNHNWDEFGQFINNTFFYLKGPVDKPGFYWTQEFGAIEAFNSGQMEVWPYPEPEIWEIKSSGLQFNFESTSNEFWDLTGERMMVMGHEKSGIDEIWAHPFMAIRDYEVGIKYRDQEMVWLSEINPHIRITPEAIIREYKHDELTLTELISVHHTKPEAVVHYEFEGPKETEILIRFKSNLRLMWPYSQQVIGGINYDWNDDLNAFIIKDEAGNFRTIVGMNRVPEKQMIGSFNVINSENQDFITDANVKLECSAMAVFKADQPLDLVIAASHFADPNVMDYAKEGLNNPWGIYENSSQYYANLLSDKLMIHTPNEDLNIGYRWAIIGTDRHFVNTPGVGRSLVAGIGTTARGWGGGHEVNGRPGYAWYFGRDSEWSAFAINAYGDYEKVKDILEMLINYQHLNGKIFHELTTSGTVHYDAADATPLFVVLAGKYLRASGDQEFIKKNWNAIQKAINYCYSTDTDHDLLINNTNVGHGWVEGGFLFGGKTTLYLASCWAEALKEASYMSGILGMKEEFVKYETEAQKVGILLKQLFWNKKTLFYNHSLNTDGSFIEEKTVMPAIPMYFSQLEPDRAGNMLNEFASNNFTANWGSRIVGEESAHFNPGGYHTGSVWPLYTGWISLAEYRYGNHIQAFSHLMNNVNVYKYWAKGFIEEVLHGAEFKPMGVCAHQCWSETMAIQPLIEGMLGFEVDANKNSLKLSPAVPLNWDQYKIENIKIGENLLNYEMQRDGNEIRYFFDYKGKESLKIYFAPTYLDGAEVVKMKFNNQPIECSKDNCLAELNLRANSTLSITYSNGISVLPFIQDPKPGDRSEGVRIISTVLEDQHYDILMEAPSNSFVNFKLYSTFNILGIENATIEVVTGNMYEVKLKTAISPEKYAHVKVSVQIERD